MGDYDKGGYLPGGPVWVRLLPGERILTPAQIKALVEARPAVNDSDDA